MESTFNWTQGLSPEQIAKVQNMGFLPSKKKLVKNTVNVTERRRLINETELLTKEIARKKLEEKWEQQRQERIRRGEVFTEAQLEKIKMLKPSNKKSVFFVTNGSENNGTPRLRERNFANKVKMLNALPIATPEEIEENRARLEKEFREKHSHLYVTKSSGGKKKVISKKKVLKKSVTSKKRVISKKK